MTTTTYEAAAPRRRKRSLPTAGTLQWLTWVVVVGLILGPFVPLLYASVRDRPLYEAGGAFTLSAYRDLFADPKFWHAALHTLEYAAMTTALSVVAGTAVAILVARTDLPGRRAFGRLTLLPLLLPSLGLVLGWIVVWGPGGYLSSLIHTHLHIGTLDINTIPGMAVIEATRLLPVAYMTCEAALARADSSLEDAARSAGAAPLKVLGSVTVPMLRPALLNAATLIFTLSIASLGIPLLLGTPHNIQFVSTYLYLQWTNAASPDSPLVSAGAMLLLLVATLLLLVRNRMLGAEARYVSVAGKAGRTAMLRLRGWRWPLAIAIALYVLFSTLVPVLGLMLMSFVAFLTPLIAPWHLFTWSNWHILGTGVYLRSIEHSALLALIGGIATTAVVALATLVAHRSRLPVRKSLPFVMLYPRAIPGLIIGIGFFWAYLLTGAPGSWLRQGIWGILLAFCIRNLPFAYVVMYPTMARIGGELDRAGRSVGAGWWRTCRSIVLPLLKPALFASFILMFVEILNDYDPALFLVRPGTEVIGTTMLDTFLQGIVGPVASLAMVQVGVTVIVLALGTLVLKIRVTGGHDA
ncbi:MAG TPA: iron ABC transporter permease [Gaiellaceae bacterium]